MYAYIYSYISTALSLYNMVSHLPDSVTNLSPHSALCMVTATEFTPLGVGVG